MVRGIVERTKPQTPVALRREQPRLLFPVAPRATIVALPCKSTSFDTASCVPWGSLAPAEARSLARCPGDRPHGSRARVGRGPVRGHRRNDGPTAGPPARADPAADDRRRRERAVADARPGADRIRDLSTDRGRVETADEAGRRRARFRRRAVVVYFLAENRVDFRNVGQDAGQRVSDPHRDAADRRPRRSQAAGRLRRLRQAGLLQHAPVGNAPGFDEDGQAAEGHARPDQDLGPLRPLEMLPAIRVRHLRAAAKGFARRRVERGHRQGTHARPGARDSRQPIAGRDRRSSRAS